MYSVSIIQKMTKFYKALAILTATALATGGTIGIYSHCMRI